MDEQTQQTPQSYEAAVARLDEIIAKRSTRSYGVEQDDPALVPLAGQVGEKDRLAGPGRRLAQYAVLAALPRVGDGGQHVALILPQRRRRDGRHGFDRRFRAVRGLFFKPNL